MPVEHLSSIYRRYKQSTDDIGTYLASTAKSCGFNIEDVIANPSKDLSERLKGKARKKAKLSEVPQTQNYLIHVQKFVDLAEFIIKPRKSPPSVPRWILSTLNRVIELRSKSSLYRSQMKVSFNYTSAKYLLITHEGRPKRAERPVS